MNILIVNTLTGTVTSHDSSCVPRVGDHIDQHDPNPVVKNVLWYPTIQTMKELSTGFVLNGFFDVIVFCE